MASDMNKLAKAMMTAAPSLVGGSGFLTALYGAIQQTLSANGLSDADGMTTLVSGAGMVIASYLVALRNQMTDRAAIDPGNGSDPVNHLVSLAVQQCVEQRRTALATALVLAVANEEPPAAEVKK